MSSVYSEISKRIGYAQVEVKELPTKEEATELLEKVKNGCIVSFEKVFKIYRYYKTPSAVADFEVLNILCEAYQAGATNPSWTNN